VGIPLLPDSRLATFLSSSLSITVKLALKITNVYETSSTADFDLGLTITVFNKPNNLVFPSYCFCIVSFL